MYLYRARKLTEDEIKLVDGSDYYSLNGNYVVLFEDELEYDCYVGLRPYLSKISLVYRTFDEDLFRKVNNIPDSAYFAREVIDGSEVVFILKDDENYYRELRVSEIKLVNYEKVEVKDSYIAVIDEVGYWRKEYSLQNKIHNVSDVCIENCGYYKLNQEMFDVISEELDIGVYDEYDKMNLFYHEWY